MLSVVLGVERTFTFQLILIPDSAIVASYTFIFSIPIAVGFTDYAFFVHGMPIAFSTDTRVQGIAPNSVSSTVDTVNSIPVHAERTST